MPTPSEVEVFKFIKRFIDRRGYPPTYRDIRDGVGLSSTSLVKNRLETLESMGYIELGNHKARSITIVPRTSNDLQYGVWYFSIHRKHLPADEIVLATNQNEKMFVTVKWKPAIDKFIDSYANYAVPDVKKFMRIPKEGLNE